MSNTKHTPGDWMWDGDPTNYDKENEAPWLVGNGGPTVVIGGEIEMFNKADVPLIAAAKEMYEALKEAVDDVMFEDLPYRIKEKIKNAIAKAEKQ